MQSALGVAFSMGMAARILNITPSTLTSKMARMVAVSCDSSMPPGAIPALLKRISSRPPVASRTVSIAACISDS